MNQYRSIARITIQLETPLHIGSGKPGELADASVVQDANGLPTIPGTSIAGVLRAAYLEKEDSENPGATGLLFGEDLGDRNNKKLDVRGSRVQISFGCIHDSSDRPVSGLADPEAITNDNDQVLNTAANNLTLRDHVRIGHHGAVDGEGKFDELVVHKGHRFTFEIELHSDEENDPDWVKLLELLCSGKLRIGGRTRRGLGAFKVIRMATGKFDLTKADEYTSYCSHPVSLAATSPVLAEVEITKEQPKPYRTLKIRPNSFWMFGGGEDTKDDPADMVPVRDTIVVWEGGRGNLKSGLPYVPASSIKGAIAHRTAFHYNCIEKVFVDDEVEPMDHTMENNLAVKQLFGFAKDGQGEESTGSRGCVVLDDIFLPKVMPQQKLQHVAIDRFTGGAYPGALYNERPFYQLPDDHMEIQIPIHLTKSKKNLNDNVLKALDKALQDVAESRLPLGAGSGRGLGRFSGEVIKHC